MTENFKIQSHSGVKVPNWEEIENPFETADVNAPRPHGALDASAIYPKDSILEDWMTLARENCEISDFQILGAILPICGAIMGRAVQMDFFGTKYPNIYAMIVAAPGQRKSTLIGFAEKLARRVIDKARFMDSMTSEEALFEQFDPERGGNPDQILIEDEGNSLFTGWEKTNYGQVVSKRILKLYDCAPWSQSFKGNKQGEDGSSRRLIERTSASLLVGATYNVCRLSKLEVKDGMWRRFLKYPAEGLARTIYHADKIDGKTWNDLAMKFERLKADLEKPLEFTLSKEANELYIQFKDSNIAKTKAIPHDLNPTNEARASVLSEELSLVMKIAMIFERCRDAHRASKPQRNQIQAETLQLAYDHVQQCNIASDSLENIARRSEIRVTAESINAQVLIEFAAREVNGFIPMSKTDLTNRFCKNAGRRGMMNSNQLYCEILPDLEATGDVRRYPIPGSKKVFYLFKTEE